MLNYGSFLKSNHKNVIILMFGLCIGISISFLGISSKSLIEDYPTKIQFTGMLKKCFNDFVL